MTDEPKETEQNRQEPAVPPGYPPPWAYYPPEEEIDLREYWRLMVDNRKLIGIITGACTVLALVAAFVMTPIYRAETLLAPVSDEKTSGLSALAGQFGDIASLVGVNLGSGSSVDESIATLKSRELGTAFMKEHGLKRILFADRWDPAKKTWATRWWSPGTDSRGPTDWEAYSIFDSIRSVDVDSKTNLVTLSIEWKNPALAAEWANDLVKQVNEMRRQEAVNDAEKNIHYLQEQLAKTGSVEVQQAIYRLIEAQTKNKMLASTREEYAFKVIDPAVAPERKVKPKRSVIVIVGAIAGMALGFVTVLLRRRFSAKE
jgi:uncharacterized protein involved in exopolysaccharide biosynthesis